MIISYYESNVFFPLSYSIGFFQKLQDWYATAGVHTALCCTSVLEERHMLLKSLVEHQSHFERLFPISLTISDQSRDDDDDVQMKTT